MNDRTCGALIKQLHDSLEKKANNGLKVYGVTLAQCSILLMLNEAEQQQMSLKELERQLHVAQSTAVGIIHRLEQKGMVEIFGDSQDKRTKVVRITKQGIVCCQQAEHNMQLTEEHLLAPLTQEERDIFINMLARIREHF